MNKSFIVYEKETNSILCINPSNPEIDSEAVNPLLVFSPRLADDRISIFV